MKHHARWMVIGCALPLLVIFLLPLFGIRSPGAMLLVLMVFFGVHLIMILMMEGGQDDRVGGRGPPGKEATIMVINVRRFGMACGVTSALLYLGCVFVMWTVGREASIVFFNSLLHGIDVSTIIRTDMPLWEMAMGLVTIFILGWLSGATIASIYNLGRGQHR